MAEYVAKVGEQHATFGWENLKGEKGYVRSRLDYQNYF